MTTARSATRVREFDWINKLELQQKALLNELVRLGCIVRASNHGDNAVRITVSFRGNMISETSAVQLDDAFRAAYSEVQGVLFGNAHGAHRG